MNTLLKLWVSLSLSGSVLILALQLLRPLVRRLSKRWQYYIWLVVLARLLLPFTPDTSLMGTLFRDIPPVQTVLDIPSGGGTAGTAPPVSAETVPPAPADTAPASPPPGDTPEPAPQTGLPLLENLWLLWLGTALVLFIRKITVYQSFAGYVRAGCEAVDSPALLDRLALLGETAGVRKPVELYVNPLMASPLLLGFFRPCIVLPSAGLPEAEFRCTILHELTHCRRRDLLYKWLVQLTVCLHWFNPLVWRMEREINRTCELACDEAVLLLLSPGERRMYGDTLLHALEAGGTYQNSVVSVTLSESAELLKERLGAIMCFQKPPRWTAVLSLALAGFLTAGAAVSGAYALPVQPEILPAKLIPVKKQADAPAFSYAGTVFTYGKTDYEMAGIGRGLITSILECTPVGKYLVIEGHCGPDHSLYFIFNTETQVFEKEIAGAHLIWRDDDITTAVYSFWSEIFDYGGNRIGDCGLDEDSYIYSLSFTETGVQALVLNEAMEETRFAFSLPSAATSPSPPSQTPAEQAQYYYDMDNHPAFSRLFPSLSAAEQEVWLWKFYEEGSLAYFSAALDGLEEDSPLLAVLTEAAYEDKNIALFSVLADRLDKTTLETWLLRAKQDRRVNFQSVLLDKLDRDWEKEALEKELDRQRLAEYAAHGITRQGKTYFYQGETVRVFLDLENNQSFYTLDINPLGTVNIKITRGTDGRINRIAPLTDAEGTRLFGDSWEDLKNGSDWDDGEEQAEEAPLLPVSGQTITVPVDIGRLEREIVWLGSFRLSEGDQIYYDVSAETGPQLQIGFAKSTASSSWLCYNAVSNPRDADGKLEIKTGALPWTSTMPPDVQLFVRAGDCVLTGVKGAVTIIKNS